MAKQPIRQRSGAVLSRSVCGHGRQDSSSVVAAPFPGSLVQRIMRRRDGVVPLQVAPNPVNRARATSWTLHKVSRQVANWIIAVNLGLQPRAKGLCHEVTLLLSRCTRVDQLLTTHST